MQVGPLNLVNMLFILRSLIDLIFFQKSSVRDSGRHLSQKTNAPRNAGAEEKADTSFVKSLRQKSAPPAIKVTPKSMKMTPKLPLFATGGAAPPKKLRRR